jgi:hypothetical protein
MKTRCKYPYFGTRFRALETVENEEMGKWGSGEEERSPELYSDVFIPLRLLNKVRYRLNIYHYTPTVHLFLRPRINCMTSLILLVTE